MQAVRFVHETDERELAVAPLGAGVASTVHVVPFHNSERVDWVPDDPV